MIWKLDENRKEYTTAAGAARYIGLPRTTFIYYTSDDYPYKVPSRIILFKKVFYKSDLDEWKNKTSKIQFSYKKKLVNTDANLSNVSNFPKQTKQSK
jgi:hypothetical protein